MLLGMFVLFRFISVAGWLVGRLLWLGFVLFCLAWLICLLASFLACLFILSPPRQLKRPHYVEYPRSVSNRREKTVHHWTD